MTYTIIGLVLDIIGFIFIAADTYRLFTRLGRSTQNLTEEKLIAELSGVEKSDISKAVKQLNDSVDNLLLVEAMKESRIVTVIGAVLVLAGFTLQILGQFF